MGQITAKYQCGYTMGNGADINVDLGYIPQVVHVTNLTDQDIRTTGYLDDVYAFGTGGTGIAVGDKITGGTSGATVVVRNVLPLSSGTWAGGNAVGVFVATRDQRTGTFTANEDLKVGGATRAVLTNGFPTQYSVMAFGSTGVTATTGAGVTPYVGSLGASAAGFTIGSTAAEEGKALFWEAISNV